MAVGGGRGRWRHSEAQRNAVRCQIEAQVQKKKREGDEEARGRWCSPEMEKTGGGTTELRRSIPAAWGRDSDESEWEKREGTTAFL